MSYWIKLTWYDSLFAEPIKVRVNVDNLDFYCQDTYTCPTKGSIVGSTVKWNDRQIFVLEKPSEIDNLISSPLTNKLAKWSEND